MIGEFNYIPLDKRECLEYNQIESELDELTKTLDPLNMDKDQLADFCRRLETALNAKKHLIKMIAEDCNIPSEKVIVISDCKLFYKCSQESDPEEINRDVTERSKEDFNGKNGLDSIEKTVAQ